MKIVSIRLSCNPLSGSWERWSTALLRADEQMSNGDYREKDGGARLGEVWQASIKGCAKWGSVMNAIGLSSA